MARSDLIVSLVKAGVKGDAAHVRKTAKAIAAEERAKKHNGVADRITKALDAPNSQPSLGGLQRSIRVKDGTGGVHRREAQRPLSSLYLDKHVNAACHELIEEQRRADVLRAHGLEPRHRVLLVGPPGNGKTSLAEGLAYELALPLLTVRYEAVVTSYLGETAQRLRRLFEFVSTEPCVLFFDEFDAIGKERGDLHETGEIKRVVTSLLLQLDALPSYCVLVGATNHPELLDRATWRRFELRLELGKPTSEHMIAYFADQLATLEGKPGYTAKRLAETIDPLSFSEAEAFFLDVRRQFVLSLGERELRTVLDDRVKSWNARASMNEGITTDGRPANIATSKA